MTEEDLVIEPTEADTSVPEAGATAESPGKAAVARDGSVSRFPTFVRDGG